VLVRTFEKSIFSVQMGRWSAGRWRQEGETTAFWLISQLGRETFRDAEQQRQEEKDRALSCITSRRR
jgi:hypothetical protein